MLNRTHILQIYKSQFVLFPDSFVIAEGNVLIRMSYEKKPLAKVQLSEGLDEITRFNDSRFIATSNKRKSSYLFDNQLEMTASRKTDGTFVVSSGFMNEEEDCGVFFSRLVNFYPVEKEEGVLFLKSGKIITQPFFERLETCNNNLFSKEGLTKLKKINLSSEEIEWAKDLREVAELSHTLQEEDKSKGNTYKILAVSKGKLFLTLECAIAALDLSTGQLLQSWHTLPTGTTVGPQQSTVLPNPAHSVLHEEAGKILGLTGYYYWEIDLQTGALQAQDCTSGFKSRRLRAMTRPVCQGDHLYFSSDEVFEKPDGTLGHDIKLAAFNWRTRQIDWEWAFDHPGEGLYQIGMPKVHGDYLAAADTGGQLHLFKKTS
ncbi:MAG: hypothetical protein ACE362_15940 [Phaeodactylibacter xiamenensis]|uniref:Uncharacterized protein n=2 Tax=Phaeodactylibacter xiamenensis TaxID=1524460 RepID=A0A098S5P8_9BACT|nr:hypothetical protein [Phaeodactylibacter xiamenensis]KGE87133.1 hypothetical protein IX84_15850 [Phaeodactylibacter xiamenensis]MCR9053290.1 hypothetical protein [bacterium]